MFVVGTAGHVDHGKTALIKALTGMDADRLPEEKARGMTTDLGFAYFEGPGGECVGVVDVPGHERFLRNMAAGAWGLDLALLVVAADDGWMAQTRTHARILASLSAPDVIIVVTKIDAAGAERAAEVARDAQDRARTLFGFAPPFRLVSALTGEGVEALKRAVLARLYPDRRLLAGGPFLYVDRVFSLPGAGTVVAGTLRGGPLSVKDELILWPQGERVRIRTLQSYKAGVDTARPVCRTALALPKPRSELRRGDLLAGPDMEVYSDREFLCRLEPLPGETGFSPADEKGKPLLRSGLEAELVLGSAHRVAVVSPFRSPGWLRVLCSEPLACPPGQAFALLRRGGTELLARGRVLAAGPTDIRSRRSLDAVLPGVPGLADALAAILPAVPGSPAEPIRRALELLSRGWTCLARGEAGKTPQETIPGLVMEGSGDRTIAFTAVSHARFRGGILETAGRAGGAVRAELESSTGLPGTVCSALMAGLEGEKALERQGARWVRPGEPRTMDKEECRLEALLVRAGAEGVEPGRNAPEKDGRVLKALCALGRAAALDNGVYWHRPVYERLAEAVLSGRRGGDRFTVGEAKERSGLSRKYVLPLLNRMEGEGLVKRDGDCRVVLSTRLR